MSLKLGTFGTKCKISSVTRQPGNRGISNQKICVIRFGDSFQISLQNTNDICILEKF